VNVPAVIALLEVFVDQLPVRRHVILGPGTYRQLAEPVPLELAVVGQPGLDLRAQLLLQLPRLHLARVADLLTVDLSRGDDRLKLHLALKLAELTRPRRTVSNAD